MRSAPSGKAGRFRGRVVAVIASSSDLQRAARLRRLPDFFELRLDSLVNVVETLAAETTRLRSPFIVTARHPAEGGHNNLGPAARRSLLLRFLPSARFVDVELRDVKSLEKVLIEAARLRVRRIVSVHDLARTPSARQISHLAERARAAGADVFKLVTRVETRVDLETLIEGFHLAQEILPTSAAGTGAFGRASRNQLYALDSALNYAHLGTALADGQLSLRDLLTRPLR